MDIRSKVTNLIDTVAGYAPQGVRGAGSQLGGSVSRGVQAAANPIATGLERAGAGAVAERVRAGASAIGEFQKNQLTGFNNLTGSRALGYGAGAASILGAAAVGSAVGAAGANKKEDGSQRMAGERSVVIGGNIMPSNLQAEYLNLAVPGSPLGGMGLLSGNHLRQSQVMQDSIVAQQHRMQDAMVIPRGRLPLSYLTPEQE